MLNYAEMTPKQKYDKFWDIQRSNLGESSMEFVEKFCNDYLYFN